MNPESPQIQAILDQWKGLSAQVARKQAFLFVRDIAYGDIGSRNPYDVLEKKKGTCSGKHALLRILLEKLGYEVQPYFAKHDFSQFPLQKWPDALREFQSKILTDYHDFLKVDVDGKWVDVDAIFDAFMESKGFPVTNWDGMSDVPLPIKAQEIFPAKGDVEDHKKRLIAALPEQVQKDRKAFLGTLTKWLDDERIQAASKK